MKELFKKMAQNIAKSTSEVIGYGVLVTDEKGVIIGCNEEKRIGEFHPPSIRVMQENRPMATSTVDAENYLNVLPGYTLPIQLFDNVLGSVSIAGLPEEVARYGLLVQKQAEIMLREQAFLESNLLRERALRDLIENVASYDPRNGNEEFIMMQAKELGFNSLKVQGCNSDRDEEMVKRSCRIGFPEDASGNKNKFFKSQERYLPAGKLQGDGIALSQLRQGSE